MRAKSVKGSGSPGTSEGIQRTLIFVAPFTDFSKELAMLT